MTTLPSTLGAKIAINVRLLFAFGFGWAGWVLWPEAGAWWGAGLLSIIAGIAAIAMAIGAVKIMGQVYRQEKSIRDYLAQGAAPKSSEIASDDDLRKAGMR